MLKPTTALVAVLAVSSVLLSAGQERRRGFEIEIDGARLTAVSWGLGETVIALPGNGSDVAWFERLGPQIAVGGFRFVAVNQRQPGT